MKITNPQRTASLALLLLFAAAALAWAFWPRALAVDTEAVRVGRFEQGLEQDGKLRVQNRYTISAPTSGELERPMLKVGDAVRQGQVLALLRPVAPQLLDARTRAMLQERVGSAQAAQAAALAQLQRQQTALEQARLEAQRAQRLARDNYLSAAARDQAELALAAESRGLEVAQAQAHVALHTLHEAQAALAASEGRRATEARWELKSPVAGSVLKLNLESGGAVSVGQPVLEIADTTQVDAVIDLLSDDAARVKPGAAVRLTLGTATLTGSVTRIEPVAFTKVSALGIEEQRVNLIVALPLDAAQQARLGDGYRVDARIELSAQDGALLLPAAALLRDGAQWSVFVMQGERARRRSVQLHDRNAQMAWVRSGVTAGERVVLYPAADLAEGRRLRTREAAR